MNSAIPTAHWTGNFLIYPAPDPHGFLWHLAYDWQTLIAAAAAIAAAYFTIRKANQTINVQREQIDVMREQVASQQAVETDRRARRLRAARASLPGVLRLICEHAEGVAKQLDAAWPAAAALYPLDAPMAGAYEVRVSVATFPAEFIEPLTSAVEHSEDGAVIEMIGSVFREAQVLDSRTRPLIAGDTISLNDLASYILEAATLYARAESLFGYARGHSETIDAEPLWDRVFSAINIIGITHEEVREKAAEERDAGLQPGEADTLPVV